MATLNELGRNSASITYGPSSTGQEMWATLQGFDTWVKNDTMQGSATATGTNVTGVSSIYTTQLRSGDVVMLAGQMRTVSTVTSDTAFSVTAGFTQGVSLPSALKQINTTLTGVSTATIRGTTTGTVSVTQGSKVITGLGTYFLSEMTNSVTTATLAGTVSLDINGNITGSGTSFNTGADGSTNRLQPGDSVWMGGLYYTIATVVSDTTATIVTSGASTTATVLSSVIIAKALNGAVGRTININGKIRQIDGITNNTVMSVNLAMDFTDSNLRVKVYPRGNVSLAGNVSNVTSSGANFLWDLVSGDQVWLGNELRTLTFASSSATTAVVSDYVGFSGTATTVTRQGLSSVPFKRDDTYINAPLGAFTTELRVGDDLIIDGTEVTVASIISNTQFRCTNEFTHTLAGSTIYKKKKVHGFVMEGTREGVATGGKLTSSTYASGVVNLGATLLPVASVGTAFVQYALIKVQAAGGTPIPLNGTAGLISASTAVNGIGTQFTTQLHVGAEIVIAGQYFTVTAIASDTALTVNQNASATVSSTPIYRTVPLYSFINSVASNNITLGHATKNALDSSAATAPLVFTPFGATDFIEYVYSAPNKTAEASVTLLNTSLDRKYVAFRFYPLATGGGSGNTVSTAGSQWSLPVYERWVASYGQANGVGINVADASTSTVYLSGVYDQTNMTQTTGGFLYMFAKPRYLIVQGKTFSNIQTQWLGCVEFERAQPEDVGTGLGVSTGVNIFTGAPVSGTPGVAPWPCYAYFNGNRFPVGSAQTPTLPIAQSGPVHGGIFSVPRVRCSTGDLTGLNAHIYSACTITTGRWGHLYELAAVGSYNPVPTPAGGFYTTTAVGSNAIPQPHMGQLVPVYTNVYNSKRFMFSPVVILGPSYDPDIRGRIFGLKVIPSALGTLMDTVSVTVDSNDFYDSTQSAADHWVITASTATINFTLANSGSSVSQSWRSLEFASQPTANTTATFVNNFRWAIPA